MACRRNEVYWGLEAVSPSKEYFGLFFLNNNSLEIVIFAEFVHWISAFYLIYFVNTNFFGEVFPELFVQRGKTPKF